nr:type II toxin-antitoxin system RelE/ParE family toxin [Methylomonas sp. EFPC1]
MDNRIARVLFVIDKQTMILLHGFIKKSQKTLKTEIDLAKQRLKALRGKQ